MNLNSFYRRMVLLFMLLAALESLVYGQRQLSLDSCLSMAAQNYPIIQQRALLDRTAEFTVENAKTGKLPRINLMGQASYQSAVTSLPSGGPFTAPQISKDQYRLYGEVLQPLTDLTVIGQQQKIVKAKAEIEEASLEVKLYGIRQRVSDLFFGVLLLDGQLEQLTITREELQRGLTRVEAAKANGVAYQSQIDQLKAELLGLDQRVIQLESAQKGFIAMLKLFIGMESDMEVELILPSATILNSDINRPELALFAKRKDVIMLNEEMHRKQNLPKFSLFFQGGVGRPALNMLSNDFDPYYIGGLRLSWSLSNFYTNDRQKELFTIQRAVFDNEQETFLFNLDLALANKNIELASMQSLIEKDNEIIQLREKIVNSAREQLSNGVITANEYKGLVADADRARLSLVLHEIERIKKQNEYKLTTGN